jgi:hypothetical protein
MNRLEELGRVDAEKAYTKKGKRNLKDEKKRIVRELKAKGGKTKKSFPDLTGDGKVTRADVLKGRGVFKKGGGADMGRKPRKRGNPAVIGEEPRRDRMKQPLKRKNYASGGIAIRGRGCEIK